MLAFRTYKEEAGVMSFQLTFDKEEYLVMFDKMHGSDQRTYRQTFWRPVGEEKFKPLNEQVWSFAISQAVSIIDHLEKLQIVQLEDVIFQGIGEEDADGS
jgi:hypothetical protein